MKKMRNMKKGMNWYNLTKDKKRKNRKFIIWIFQKFQNKRHRFLMILRNIKANIKKVKRNCKNNNLRMTQRTIHSLRFLQEIKGLLQDRVKLMIRENKIKNQLKNIQRKEKKENIWGIILKLKVLQDNLK